MLDDLNELGRDQQACYWLITKNGMIGMMQRNVVVKKAPQRFQDEKDLSKIDICICFDDRVFDAVLESMAPCCF